MTTYLGKSCSFGLPRVLFVNCRRFMYLVISLLVYRAGCGIWLYQFLIIAYLFTLLNFVGWGWSFFVCCLARQGSTVVFFFFFFGSSVPVVLFDTPEISRCRSQHVSVESSSLFHQSIYLWLICFPWWSIDEIENLHADRTTATKKLSIWEKLFVWENLSLWLLKISTGMYDENLRNMACIVCHC